MEESSLNSHNPFPILKIPEVHNSTATKNIDTCNGSDAIVVSKNSKNGVSATYEDPNAIESIPIEHDEDFE